MFRKEIEIKNGILEYYYPICDNSGDIDTDFIELDLEKFLIIFKKGNTTITIEDIDEETQFLLNYLLQQGYDLKWERIF